MENKKYCIGLDYGTDSCRAIVVDSANGKELATSIFVYPRWKQGLYCEPSKNQFRQHPKDYIEGLEYTINECVKKVGKSVAENICAISIDTTGSTPVAVNEKGIPLSLLPEFEEDPDAMFYLWKDHTSIKEMDEINHYAKSSDAVYLKYVGNIYSSEWFWAKLLHALRVNSKVQKSCYSWVEHCDWMPFLLTGGKNALEIKRSVCSAGHKGIWSEEWNGFPPDDFFTEIDPLLKGYVQTLPKETYTSDQSAGYMSAEWSQRLGLTNNVVVGIGALDAHIGAVGGQIEPYHLSMVMGTSTCDMLVAPVSEMNGKFVPGICGLVKGSIIPNMIGMEAGQSAFGDVYAWYKNLLSWALNISSSATITEEMIEKQIDLIMPELNRQAASLPFNENAPISLDWFNGRRTPDANPYLKGMISGLNLGTTAAEVYCSLVEATCFGTKAIVERFIQEGVPIKGLIGLGGIAQKSSFVMQTMADVINMPIRVNKSEQTCALGAAMFAATVAGIYPNVEEAMKAMGQGFAKEYFPNNERTKVYEKRYLKYLKLGETYQNQQ